MGFAMKDIVRSNHHLRFRSFSLDPQTHELFRNGTKVRLYGQPLEMLAILMERPGELVTREVLRSRLWPEQTYVDYEHSINSAVRRLRETLGDDAENPKFIETVPRFGYRFIAPVDRSESNSLAPAEFSRQFESAEPKVNQAPAAVLRSATPAEIWRVRRWSLGIAVVVLVFTTTILLVNPSRLKDRWMGRQSMLPLDPKHVAVALFENRTGNPSLDNLGRMATESIIAGLEQINSIHVVPYSKVLEMATPGLKNGTQDPVQALAEATSSGLVVSGSVYQQGQILEFRTTITDMLTNRPLWTLEPADGGRDNVAGTVGIVAQRITDAVAARYLNPYFNLLLEEERAPALAAQKEFATGLELFYSDPAAAIINLSHAIEIDHDFFLARYILAYATNNSGKIAQAVAQLDGVEKNENLTALQRRRVQLLRANIDGRSEEVYSIACDIARRTPEEHINAIDVALGAIWSNRPSVAVENFKGLRGPPFFIQSNTLGLYFLMEWTGALNQLGRHEEELQEARWGASLYPHLLNPYAYQARALVALGRLEEANALVDHILAMPSTWSYSTCCLPHGTPGYVMLSAADELRSHDHRDAALRMANRAVDWYRSRVGDEAKEEDTRSSLGEALYRAEQWREAKILFRALSAEHPDNVIYLGRLGTLAARHGLRPVCGDKSGG